MKYFVTGGAGFIGGNFIRYWLEHHPEDQIINFDSLTYAGNLESLRDIENNSNYTFVRGDIRNPDQVNKYLEGVNGIIHFAAESHVDRSILDAKDFITTNIEGTYVLLEQAKEKGIRFHHVSTDEVFGSLNLDSSEKFNEDTPYSPRSPYAASKAASDHLVRAYHVTYGLPVTISNTSNNYGPYQFPEKLISLAITNAMEDKKIPVYGEGNQVRDWLYVLDHCRAIDLILEKGKSGETYLIGGMTDDIPNIEVVKQILKILGKPESLIEYVTDRPGHDVRYAIDWSKAKNDLGYTPEYSFDEYLKSTVEWYQKNEEWWKRVKSGEYQDFYDKQYGA